MNTGISRKKAKKRYNVPVIGHFANRSIRFNSINEAESFTGISYTLIFEACIGKIYKARNVYWEFENGAHYIKYKAHYIRAQRQLEEEDKHGYGKKHLELEANSNS
jgi:F0F1-type ATP synthase gamma subunit